MLIVQKFGGSSLAGPDGLRRAAAIIAAARARGDDVVAVVSARGDATDELLALARELSSEPPLREMDALLGTGEQQSAALLAITLDESGQAARSLSGAQAGIFAAGEHGDGRIMLLLPRRLLETLAEGRTAVVCGFQGVDAEGDLITLGRGGSDTSAVAIAAALQAGRCEIYTDVPGIYTADPRLLPEARFLPEIDYADMLHLAQAGSRVLHDRSVQLAMEQGVEIRLLSSFEPGAGSLVRHIPAAERPAFAGLTRLPGEGSLTLVGRAADAAALSRLVIALGEAGLPVLGGALGEGSLRLLLPPERLEEAMHLCHRLFLNS